MERRLFGLVEIHQVEQPTEEVIRGLLKDYWVFAYKIGSPNLTSRVKDVINGYIMLKNGIWCQSYFSGVFYLKWFWSK